MTTKDCRHCGIAYGRQVLPPLPGPCPRHTPRSLEAYRTAQGRAFVIVDRHVYVSTEYMAGIWFYGWKVLVMFVPDGYDFSDPNATADSRKLERGWVWHYEPRDMVRLQMLGAGAL